MSEYGYDADQPRGVEQQSAPEDTTEYTVIIDIGESTTKVGLAGDDPVIFPTIVGKPKYKNLMQDVAGVVKEVYCGTDADNMRGVMKIEYPISRGAVYNWEDYFAILNHIFSNVLRVPSANCHVIYAIHPLTPPDTVRYYADVLFTTHRVKSVLFVNSVTLSCYSSGITTGLAIEIGEGMSFIAPVIKGQIYEPSLVRLPIGNFDITEYLKTLFSHYGVFLNYSAQREILRQIKEDHCIVSLNLAVDTQGKNVTEHKLPDGEVIKINDYERYNAPEVLFNPPLMGYQFAGIPDSIISSLMKISREYLRTCLGNIVLSGGGAHLKGIKARIVKEIDLRLNQLGPIPEPVAETEAAGDAGILSEISATGKGQAGSAGDEKKVLIQAEKPKPKMDNCPKCGEMIDTGSKFCPFCGAKTEIVTINIPTAEFIKKTPEKCPNCKKKLETSDQFCPNCGNKIEPELVPTKVDRKEEKMIKKVQSADKKKMGAILEDISSEYEGIEEDIDSLMEKEKEREEKEKELQKKKEEEKLKNQSKASPNSSEQGTDHPIIKITIPPNATTAIYKGASIIGSMASIKQYFVTEDEFRNNVKPIILDITKKI